VYSARTLTLPDYWVGRTLFMGDAAHLLPIFGVRGANTGFQDAQALAWRLALVCRGQGAAALLANYSTERVGAAWEIIEEAGKSTRFMTPPTRGFRLLRDAVLSLSLTEAFVRPLYHWRTSRPHEYSHSSLNCRVDDNAQFLAGPAHGAPPLNVRLTNTQFLLDHLGGGFDLLWFGEAEHLPTELHDGVAQWQAQGFPLRLTCITPSGPSVAGLVQSPTDVPWLQVLSDPQGRVHSRYGVTTPGAAYLLRPDQHICARWLRLDAQRLNAALKQATTGEAS
jgi:3-(3-hydroxy-phenyl)propionate hydroxylase